MLNDFKLSFSLKNTYRTNAIIYSLKRFPIIKKILPSEDKLYKNDSIRSLSIIISIISEIASIFVGKFMYFLFLISMLASLYPNKSLAFVNILFFLTIIGGFLNTYLFDPSKDKYYAIVLMHFDAKKYVLCNYIYFLLKSVIGTLPFMIIYGLIFKVNISICYLLIFYLLEIKSIFVAISLKSNKSVKNENRFVPLVIIVVIILLFLAYLLPYFNIGITNKLFFIIFIILLPLSLISFKYIVSFKYYNKTYKKLLKQDDIIGINDVENSEKLLSLNKIDNNINIDSSKEGYAYFNDLFTKRHRRLLTKSTKRISISAVILFAILSILLIIFKDKTKEVNSLLQTFLPYFLFVMYFINRGEVITKTMFMNCDHSMLTYRFYKQKDSILCLFKERLKTLIKLNIIPGIIIGLGLDILIYVSGGASLEIYIITFLTIISMSIFFSVHYLVLYYLLQPYNIDLEIKNPTFSMICGITYFICYMAINIELPTIIFGTCMIIFSILYSLISLFLAYKYAPKTFKLK